MSMQSSISVSIRGGNGKMASFNVELTNTVRELKQIYIDRELGHGSVDSLVFMCSGKRIANNKTLRQCGIRDQSMIFVIIRVCGGGGYFEERHDEWTIMYERCPVCVHKNYNGKNKLSKGYWYHPGSNKAEFKSDKPGTYAVETKHDKIRCSGCKNECDAKDWIYKCPNHDYQQINL
eukprot:368805_1